MKDCQHGMMEFDPDGAWCPDCEHYFPNDILEDLLNDC